MAPILADVVTPLPAAAAEHRQRSPPHQGWPLASARAPAVGVLVSEPWRVLEAGPAVGAQSGLTLKGWRTRRQRSTVPRSRLRRWRVRRICLSVWGIGSSGGRWVLR